MDWSQRRLTGFLAPASLDQVAEDELALAAGVAGVDEGVHVGALDEALEELEPGFGFLDGPEVEVLGENGEVLEVPLAALDLDALGGGELDEVADGGGDDGLVASKKSPSFLKPPRARAISPATLGFSAMIRLLPIIEGESEPRAKKRRRKSLQA